MILYIFCFFFIIFVISAVSAIVENKSVCGMIKKTVRMFIETSCGMCILALAVYFLSR
jgi:hypothetical protein